MTANPHLSPILDAFLQIESPGHALLITAPWGAGKTSALTRLLASHDHVFVSLFGIDGPAAFDQALFDAALARDGGQASSTLAQNTAKVMDGAMKIIGGILEKHSNATIDISGQYRRAVLSQLPKILVFDDLERARLPAPQLLALINRFVEHEGKSVILIANEAELDGRAGGEGISSDNYRRWKEKVIGRTVTLAPDLEPVLAACLDGLPEGPGRDALTTRKDLIRSVFTLSRIANLRLLRLALQDCAALVARLPPPCGTRPNRFQASSAPSSLCRWHGMQAGGSGPKNWKISMAKTTILFCLGRRVLNHPALPNCDTNFSPIPMWPLIVAGFRVNWPALPLSMAMRRMT